EKLALFAPRRPGSYLEVWRADGSLLYHDSADMARPGPHWRSMGFQAELPHETVTARFAEDCSREARMLVGLAVTLVVATLAGSAFVGFGTTWRVRRGLQPLQL